MPSNKLNNLDPKRWLKFQKSWFIHNPPPRKKGVLVHPAKFPETMAQEFIEFFTKQGETVLDPMAGTGSTSYTFRSENVTLMGISPSERAKTPMEPLGKLLSWMLN